MELVYENRDNYDKNIKIEGSSCPFYSKKAINEVHPQSDFVIIGCVGKGLKKKIGEVQYENKAVDYYASNYLRMRFKVIGYIAVGQNLYLEVVKPKGLKTLLLCLAVLLLLLSTLFYFMKGSDIDPLAKDYVPSNGALAQTDPDRIVLPSYEQLTLKAGTDTAYVALYNPANNPCYFKFTIYLTDSNEQIFESKLIPPGQAVTAVKFNQNFQEGVYGINIIIDSYSLEEKEALNGGKIESQIVALK